MKQIWPHVDNYQSLYFDLVIPLPRYLTKRNENKCPQKDLQNYLISSFIHSSPRWKQYKYPSTGDWINSLWYIHWMEYYSAVKRNELLINATTWMNFKNIMCWGKGAGLKKVYMIWLRKTLTWYLGKGRTKMGEDGKKKKEWGFIELYVNSFLKIWNKYRKIWTYSSSQL